MDFSTAFGATFREVASGERDGSPTHIVRASRTFPTTPDDLWTALTEKTRLRRWFAEASGDLRPGGHYAIEGNASGEITACDPPKSLALTWEYDGGLSWVTVTVEGVEDGALLTLEHEIPTDEKSEAHWDRYGPGAAGVGWDYSILGLDAHLSNGGAPGLEAGTAWAEGAEGKATMREWAEAWGMAHIKAGAPPQTAMDMADRTAVFYAGDA